jgi:hypothetical protein
MQHLNSGFNNVNVDDSTHINMLIVQKMWKSSLNYSIIITKYWVTCVLLH